MHALNQCVEYNLHTWLRFIGDLQGEIKQVITNLQAPHTAHIALQGWCTAACYQVIWIVTSQVELKILGWGCWRPLWGQHL